MVEITEEAEAGSAGANINININININNHACMVYMGPQIYDKVACFGAPFKLIRGPLNLVPPHLKDAPTPMLRV